MREAVGIVNACRVDHHAVAALHVVDVETVRGGENLRVRPRDGDIRQHDIALPVAPQHKMLSRCQQVNARLALHDGDERGRAIQRGNHIGGQGADSSWQQQRAIGADNGLSQRWRQRCLRGDCDMDARVQRFQLRDTRHRDWIRGGIGLSCGQYAYLEDQLNQFAQAYQIVLGQHGGAIRFQASIVDIGAIHAAEVAQDVLAIGVANLGVATRDRVVIDEERDARLPPDGDGSRLAEPLLR